MSIEPSTVGNVDPDGLLNGLEILRMVGDTGGNGDSPSSHSKKIIIFVGSTVARVTMVMAIALFLLRVRRRKKPEKKLSRTWAAFSASALGPARADAASARSIAVTPGTTR
jgi:hypothetical protein